VTHDYSCDLTDKANERKLDFASRGDDTAKRSDHYDSKEDVVVLFRRKLRSCQ
jgi:hypothetical protein